MPILRPHEDTSRMVFCPHCGHPQKITFAFNEVQAIAVCGHCGRSAKFEMAPSGSARWVIKR
jgi:transcription elongation factor Elf1